MSTWTPSSRSRTAAAKAGLGGGLALTIFLRAEYGRLFGHSPLDTTLPYEPATFLVASGLVGIVIAVLLDRWTGDPLDRYDVFVLAVSVGVLPAIVVFSFVTRVGVVTGFGPTVSVEGVGHLVVGLFFVLVYAGFGAALAGLVFVLVVVGACGGALIVVAADRRFDQG